MSLRHRSSISQNSKSTSHFINSIDEVSDSGLAKQVNDLKYQIKVLSLENEIIENTILRLEPGLMHGVQQALEYASKLQQSTPVSSLAVGSFVKSQASKFALDSIASPSRMLTSPSRISTKRVESSARIGGTVIFGSGPKINVLERSELVSIEMEILINTLEKARKKAATKHALLRAQIEEISIRVTDAEKSNGTFKQVVIIEGWDRISQRIPAEIWIRFMTEWVKMTDSQIGKLRLRTSTLNTQYSKLKGQIKFKAELSESLRPVDFEKLKIENNDCLEVIEKKFVQLVELKKMTGEANLNLTIHKKLMMEQNSYLTKIIDSIKTKQRQTKDLDKERDVIKVQADSLDDRLQDVKKIRLAYEVPNVMDYVKIKSEVTELKHSIKLMENRYHIQQIALQSLNRKMQALSQ